MKHDEMLRELLGLSVAGVPDPAEPYRLGRIGDAEVRPIEWLWEGYILKRQVTLFDAIGGSGKTRLLLALCACGSNGIIPFTDEESSPQEIKPFHSLIFATEDDRGDIQHVYKSLGGKLDYLEVWDPKKYGHFQCDADGFEKLQKVIEVNGFDLVAFDPVLQYVPQELRSQNDNVAVTQFLARQREVAQTSGAAIINVRHWAKGAQGREVRELGAGGEAWRNGSRGQIVFFPHPENNKHSFQALCVPARATLRTTEGRPFAIEIKDGRQGFITPDHVELDSYASRYEAVKRKFGLDTKPEVDRGGRGPVAEELQKCMDFIIEKLTEKPLYYKAVKAICTKAGFSERTFYRARTELLSRGMQDDRGSWSWGHNFAQGTAGAGMQDDLVADRPGHEFAEEVYEDPFELPFD